MNRSTEVLFLAMADGRGQRLIVHDRPARGALRGCVLFLPPFAEEANKSRRMAALQARALAEAGFAVLRVDLLGCGDSSGDFADARWEDWLQDAVESAHWLLSRHRAPLTLWGLRAGCLLALEASRRLDDCSNLVLWQPALSGKTVVQQFLRLKLAAELQGDGATGIAAATRAQFERGETVEIAGYRTSAALIRAIEAASPALPDRPMNVAWLEVSPREDRALLPASRSVVERWANTGHAVSSAVCRGPAFWQTTEIEEAPELVAATTAAFVAASRPLALAT